MVLFWHHGGIVVLFWHHGGIVVLLWHHGGIVVLFWHHGVFLVLVILTWWFLPGIGDLWCCVHGYLSGLPGMLIAF